MWYNPKTKVLINPRTGKVSKTPKDINSKNLKEGTKIRIQNTDILPTKLTNHSGGSLYIKLNDRVEGIIERIHYKMKISLGVFKGYTDEIEWYEVKINLSENENGKLYTIKSVKPEEVIEIWIE